MRITVRVFFRSITVRNRELIPDKGPLMLLANHPSTFMDPIVIATILNRKVFFLAKGELFKSRFAKWLLPKFNMIPVYRKQDDPNQMSKNQETFKKCFEHFEKGGVILMFPEGISITERKLRPIKTGAARIVLGAETRNDFKLGIQVVTIGLNYDNPHKFNRDLFINIDAPIKAIDYKEQYAVDNFKAAENLTEEIRSRLEKLVIAIEDEKADSLVKDIEMLYKYKLSKDLGISKDDKLSEFNMTKNIIETVNYYLENDIQRVETIRLRIKHYFNNLNLLGLDDIDLAKNQKNRSFFKSNIQALFTVIIGFPVYLYGLINNYLPFEIPGWLAKKISKSIEFRGAIGMVGGMFTFLIFYTTQIILVWKYSHIKWLTIIYGAGLPLSGVFTYWYFHVIGEIRTKWMLLILFYKKSIPISNLIIEREQIISEFDKAKKRIR
jgi:1-acyl-sn-glycerol-3-phosphate acyltransferase